MTRRDLMKCAGAAGIGAVLDGVAAAAGIAGKDRKPNILFIMTDQQHCGMMSCAGNAWLKTPAMDALARDGIRFEHAYCANPISAPSRTSMATGVMSCRLGADDNDTSMRVAHLPPEVDANSMGKLLKRAGYATFYGGKVHMCRSLAPDNAGYDTFFVDERERLPGACLAFITTKRDKPFFAVASFINPHDICFAHRARNGKGTGEVSALYKKASALPVDELPPVPPNYAIPEHEPAAIEKHLNPKAVTPAITMRHEYDEHAWRINRWMYHRLTEKVDRHIGELLDGLEKAGLKDDTVLIFTSDHGNMDASHRLASKSLFYDEAVKVPLVIRYPNGDPGGRVDRTHLVSTGLDILPTICDYAGIERPKHLLGRSLRPLAEGKNIGEWRSFVASENQWARMIRSRNFKYCVFLDPKEESIVDLRTDPGEMHNGAADPKFKDALAEHRILLKQWVELSGDKEGVQYLCMG